VVSGDARSMTAKTEGGALALAFRPKTEPVSGVPPPAGVSSTNYASYH
jgi:hypothetical protein